MNVRPRLEALEDRLVPDACYWRAAGPDTNMNNGNNWWDEDTSAILGRAPNVGDDLSFVGVSRLTCVVPVNSNVACRSLSSTAGWAGGELQINGTVSVNGNGAESDWAGGQIAADTDNGVLNIAGGCSFTYRVEDLNKPAVPNGLLSVCVQGGSQMIFSQAVKNIGAALLIGYTGGGQADATPGNAVKFMNLTDAVDFTRVDAKIVVNTTGLFQVSGYLNNVILTSYGNVSLVGGSRLDMAAGEDVNILGGYLTIGDEGTVNISTVNTDVIVKNAQLWMGTDPGHYSVLEIGGNLVLDSSTVYVDVNATNGGQCDVIRSPWGNITVNASDTLQVYTNGTTSNEPHDYAVIQSWFDHYQGNFGTYVWSGRQNPINGGNWQVVEISGGLHLVGIPMGGGGIGIGP